MIDIWLCWCVGIILISVGLLTAIYLIFLQMRRGATGLTVLSTSDTLALTVIGVLFIANGLNTSHFLTDSTFHNETLVRRDKQEVNEVLSEECDFQKILMGYGIFLAPFLNAFLSMLTHAVEVYHDIVRKAESKNVATSKQPNTEDAANPRRKQISISDQLPRRRSVGSENVHLRRPTLIAELELVKQHVTEIAIEPSSSSSPNDVDGSKPSSSKTIQDIDVFQVSNLPKQNVRLPKLETHELARTPDPIIPKFHIRNLSRADLKNCRRLALSLLVQWLLPIVAILLLFTSNMEEHSFEADSRIEETTCYVDNIASALRISPECIDQLRQENYIKSVLSKPMFMKDNSQIINRYSLQQRNKTGDVDRITSMIVKQIYGHVDEFNKTRRLKPKRLTKLAGPSRVSNTMKHKSRRKMHERHNITDSHGVKIPHFRTLVKPTYDINLTRLPASAKTEENVKKKGEGENVDGSAGYYDELPADYEENEDEAGDENGSEGVSGEAMSEEVTVKPSPPKKSNADKEDSEKIVYDEVVSDEGKEPDEPEEENTSKSSPKPEVTTQKPQNVKRTSTTAPTQTEDEEGSEEVTDSTPRPTLNPSPGPTKPSVDQDLDLPSSVALDIVGTFGLPISLQKNNTLGGFLVQNIEEFNNIKICVKKCSISTNFMKGYLFAVLFLGYFIPIIVAIVIYIVIVKNVNTVISEQTSKREDSESKEDTDMCTDMSCLAEIVKQFILISILMWTPTFIEILLRTWFCVRSPRWVTMLLFALGQVHGIVRNFFNMKLVKADTKGQVYRGLFSGIMRRNDSAVCPSMQKNHATLTNNLKEKLFMKNEEGLFGKILPKNLK